MKFNILNKKDKQSLKEMLSSYPKTMEDLKKQICDLKAQNEKFQRIIEHYVPKEITGYSTERKVDYEYVSQDIVKYIEYPEILYLYKNGKEYVFQDLYIDSPKFEQDEQDNIVYAMSGDGDQHYLLDLNTLNWIKYADYSKEKR